MAGLCGTTGSDALPPALTPRVVVLKRVGKATGKRVMLPDTWEELLHIASEKLFQGGEVGGAFDQEGNEVDDIDVVALVGVPGDALFVGEPGEPWRAPAVHGAAHPQPIREEPCQSARPGGEECNAGAEEEEGASPEELPASNGRNEALNSASWRHAGGKSFTMRSLVCSFFQPWSTFSVANLLWPIDHSRTFKLAVGLAKTNKEMKAHTMHMLSSWIVVSAIILGVAVMLLSMKVNPDSVAAQAYPWIMYVFQASNFILALGSMTGPVGMGSLLLINCSACGDANFDLFMQAAEHTFMFYEFCVIQMCYNAFISMALIGFVVTDSFALAMLELCLSMVVCAVGLFFINTTTALTLYGGLLREGHRMLPFLNEFSYDSFSERRRDIVDGLVREVRQHGSVFSLLRDYATQGRESRGGRRLSGRGTFVFES
mmetsp:Transcript_128410/g.357453  ORF Transcript_128410/g.357453 Transcript_128410/m.357453 type:complete len:430 (-) Transcript_128410:61-1350(-)